MFTKKKNKTTNEKLAAKEYRRVRGENRNNTITIEKRVNETARFETAWRLVVTVRFGRTLVTDNSMTKLFVVLPTVAKGSLLGEPRGQITSVHRRLLSHGV